MCKERGLTGTSSKACKELAVSFMALHASDEACWNGPMGVCPEFTLSRNRPEIIESTASATNANPNTTAREEIAGNWKTLVVRFLGRAMEVV